MRAIRGTHQSSVLSEMSSQFQDECSAVPGRFCIERWADSGVARRNFVFGPATFTTGCKPIVLVTTPPHPASNARMMLASDSVGGADASRNGFSNRRPVNETASCCTHGAVLERTAVYLTIIDVSRENPDAQTSDRRPHSGGGAADRSVRAYRAGPPGGD